MIYILFIILIPIYTRKIIQYLIHINDVFHIRICKYYKTKLSIPYFYSSHSIVNRTTTVFQRVHFCLRIFHVTGENSVETLSTMVNKEAAFSSVSGAPSGILQT